MNLEKLINNDIKSAMLAKDKRKLAALRAIKAALLLEKTGKDVSSGEIPESVELALLQKLVKQRRESADLYKNQNRPDLAEEEVYQAEVIQAYLPEQMSEEEIKEAVALGAQTRHWSMILQGSQTDFEDFKLEFQNMMKFMEEKSRAQK